MFPGTEDTEIGLMLVSDRDVDVAKFDAQMYLERQCKRVQLELRDFIVIDPDSLDRETYRQILLKAVVDPGSTYDNPIPFFDNIDQIRSLDSVLVQQLWDAYCDYQDVVNPRLKLTEKGAEELADALKEPLGAKVVLAHFERETLCSLVRILAAPLATSQNGNSSISTT